MLSSFRMRGLGTQGRTAKQGWDQGPTAWSASPMLFQETPQGMPGLPLASLDFFVCLFSLSKKWWQELPLRHKGIYCCLCSAGMQVPPPAWHSG